MDLQDYLQRIGQTLGSHSSLLIISANADVMWTQSLIPLMRRGVMPTVFLLDPVSFGGSAKTQAIENTLQSLGVPCHLTAKEMLDKRQARPGHAGEWEWRISATGRAIPVRAPVSDWRRLE
jgi:hypothetical protein